MVRQRYSVVGIGLLLMSTLGCGTFYNLQPYRLQRLNRGVNGMPTSGYFSVSDPIEKETTPTPGQPITSNTSNRTQVQSAD